MAEKLLDAMVLRALALKLCENEADAHVDARHPCLEGSRAAKVLEAYGSADELFKAPGPLKEVETADLLAEASPASLSELLEGQRPSRPTIAYSI